MKSSDATIKFLGRLAFVLIFFTILVWMFTGWPVGAMIFTILAIAGVYIGFVAYLAQQDAVANAEDKIAPKPLQRTSGDYGVELRSAGLKKINVIKQIRALTKLGLRESKELVDTVPSTVISGISKNDAMYAYSLLESVGASVVITLHGMALQHETAFESGGTGVVLTLNEPMPGRHSVRDCPNCLRLIPTESKVCKHCEQLVEPAKVQRTAGNYTLVLQSTGSRKINVIKQIRILTEFGLRESKELADTPPSTILHGISKSYATHAAAQLEGVGATVKIVAQNDKQ
ncbi:MAG: ribosomal protein L7/L12 [Candidatus Promineifilaceae bacterium]